MEGWIQLHRQMTEWEWYDDANPCRIFLHCLLKANWKEKRWRGINIPRGSFFTSSEHLASDLKLSRQETRSALNKLKSTGDITTKPTSSGLLVTVCKFDTYNLDGHSNQPPNQPPNQPASNQLATSEQPASNQRATTTEKGNKDNKETREDSSLTATSQTRSDAAGSGKAQNQDYRDLIQWSPEGFTGISEEIKDRWKIAYPACDLTSQIARASEWLLANPQKKKRKPGRFLVNWLARAQEKGGDANANQSKGNAKGGSSRYPGHSRNDGTANADRAGQYAGIG